MALRSPFLDNDLVRTIFRAPPEAIASDEPCLRLIEQGNPRLAAIPSDRGVVRQPGLAAAAMHALHEFSFKAEYHTTMECLNGWLPSTIG